MVKNNSKYCDLAPLIQLYLHIYFNDKCDPSTSKMLQFTL